MQEQIQRLFQQKRLVQILQERKLQKFVKLPQKRKKSKQQNQKLLQQKRLLQMLRQTKH
jgi:hypothetical protein